MARKPIVPPSERIVTQYHDIDGNLVLVTEYDERLVIGPDGSVTKFKQAENIQLVSGEMFNPTMAMGPNPALLPGLCSFCQQQRRSPLTNAKHLRICADCGRPCCSLHRRQSTEDRQWRCRRCDRRHRLGRGLRFIFMERVEE